MVFAMKKIIFDEVRMSFIFTVPEPFPEDDLINNLIRRKFTEITDIPKKVGSETFGIERLDIVKKGGCKVIYDDKGGTLSVAGKSVSEVIERFMEVKKVVKEMVSEESENIETYETTVKGKVFTKSKTKPLEFIANFLGFEKLSKFKEVIGEEPAPFCIRFCPKEKIKTIKDLRRTKKWFDFNICPYIPNPQYFGVSVVLRDPDYLELINTTKRIEEIIMGVISIIMREAKQ